MRTSYTYFSTRAWLPSMSVAVLQNKHTLLDKEVTLLYKRAQYADLTASLVTMLAQKNTPVTHITFQQPSCVSILDDILPLIRQRDVNTVQNNFLTIRKRLKDILAVSHRQLLYLLKSIKYSTESSAQLRHHYIKQTYTLHQQATQIDFIETLILTQCKKHKLKIPFDPTLQSSEFIIRDFSHKIKTMSLCAAKGMLHILTQRLNELKALRNQQLLHTVKRKRNTLSSPNTVQASVF
jgi:hypothetical protein